MSGLFPNAWHVARREFLTRVRGRTFIISTVLLAIVGLGLALAPTILRAIGLDQPPRIAVHVTASDLSTDPVLALQAALAADSADTDPDAGPRVTRVTDPEQARQEVAGGDLNGLLIVARSSAGELAFEFVSDAGPTSRTRQIVEQTATAITISDRLELAGVEPADRGRIFAPPDFSVMPVSPSDGPDGERDPDEFGGRFMIAYVIVILTFIAVLTYGQWVAQSVAEEKSGRVMELLITAASPRQLLGGKVFGTGAAGLAQYLVVIASVVVGFVGSGPLEQALGIEGDAGFVLPTLPLPMVAGFVVFFLGGFILYATLYAAAGSMVSRIEDVQQAAGPLLVVAMVGYFASFAALNTPDADWVGLLSLVPFFSPYLMPARMVLTRVSLVEIIAALVILVVAVMAAIWVASRIYSAGVLLYGQRPGIRAVLRATRVAR